MYTVLNNKEHNQLRVFTDHGAHFGEAVNRVPVLADELKSLVLDFPVCLFKDPKNGKFSMHALLGIDSQENLFLQGDSWTSQYIPAHFRRQPFMAGIKGEGESPTPENLVLTIDMESPRVSSNDGVALFEVDGSPSSYLRQTSQMVFSLVPAMNRNEAFIQALLANDLLDAVQLTLTLKSGENHQLDGMYTVNEEKLSQLNAEQVQWFHRQGYLQACHYLIAAVGNIQKLVNLKNNR
ncbi:SapC family protein [Thalassotalea litorea]|uniref:SapC family protein n=1 Tax=Thalassotalea litorea TaxID=2020715 RepID=A0A5R9ILH8_9GAMM|nr:SapC family protein [Thalassotalea litorea]TLU66384.1 SapC family protein [Thalassotalea litorea]